MASPSDPWFVLNLSSNKLCGGAILQTPATFFSRFFASFTKKNQKKLEVPKNCVEDVSREMGVFDIVIAIIATISIFASIGMTISSTRCYNHHYCDYYYDYYFHYLYYYYL